MAKVVPFPTRRVLWTAQYVLRLSTSDASRKRLSKPVPWSNRPASPETLGNMLQHLARLQPAAVLVIESMVADILAQIVS